MSEKIAVYEILDRRSGKRYIATKETIEKPAEWLQCYTHDNEMPYTILSRDWEKLHRKSDTDSRYWRKRNAELRGCD